MQRVLLDCCHYYCHCTDLFPQHAECWAFNVACLQLFFLCFIAYLYLFVFNSIEDKQRDDSAAACRLSSSRWAFGHSTIDTCLTSRFVLWTVSAGSWCITIYYESLTFVLTLLLIVRCVSLVACFVCLPMAFQINQCRSFNAVNCRGRFKCSSA